MGRKGNAPNLAAWLLAGAATAGLFASPALAQSAARTTAPSNAIPAAGTATKSPSEAMTDEDYEVEALIVEANRSQPGAVIGDIPPENQFRPADIRAYGVSTVSELIDALSPQLSSGEGRDADARPVILINGARISSFTEIRDLPTEAILRVDILPEEVALKYGYAAETKVMNFVLRPFFRAHVGEGGYKTSFRDGGGDTADLHGTQVQIVRQNRLIIDGKLSDSSRLLESDRDLAQPHSDAAYRTLSPDRLGGGVNFVLSRPLGNGIAGTVNADVESTGSTALLGVDPTAPRALVRDSNSITGHFGGSAAGAFKGWRWTATANLDSVASTSTTQRNVAGAGYTDASNSTSTTGEAQLMVNGNLFPVPAGTVTTTVTGGLTTSRLDSDFVRLGVPGQGVIRRDSGQARANLDIPLTSRKRDILPAIGDLSLNFNVALNDLSDFGALSTVGAGLVWGPTTKLHIVASYTANEGAPSAQQLGNPVQATPGVQTYDFRRGVTANVTQVSGGNPNLKADDRHVIKLGATYKPFDKTDLTIQANYVATHTDNLISGFPTGSTQIEDAFPERFIRNAAGELTQIDARPVNFDHRDTEQLRYGFTYRRAIGPQPPQRQPGGFQRPGGQAGSGQGARRQRGQGGQGQGSNPTQTTQNQAAPGQPTQGQPGQGQPGQGAPPEGAGPPDGGPPAGFSGAPPEGGGPPGGGFRGGGGPGGGGPRGGGGGGRGGFGGFGGGGGANYGGPTGFSGPGAFQIGLYHTVYFKDEVRIRAGLPTLDLLNGASLGSGAGTARNAIDLQSNLSKGAYGLALTAKWKEGSTIHSNGAAGTQDLIFSDLTTVGLRVFADLRATPWFKAHPFFRGARLTASVDNLFNQIQGVHDAAGNVPIVYQPDYLDPQGRTYSLRFRKVF